MSVHYFSLCTASVKNWTNRFLYEDPSKPWQLPVLSVPSAQSVVALPLPFTAHCSPPTVHCSPLSRQTRAGLSRRLICGARRTRCNEQGDDRFMRSPVLHAEIIARAFSAPLAPHVSMAEDKTNMHRRPDQPTLNFSAFPSLKHSRSHWQPSRRVSVRGIEQSHHGRGHCSVAFMPWQLDQRIHLLKN